MHIPIGPNATDRGYRPVPPARPRGVTGVAASVLSAAIGLLYLATQPAAAFDDETRVLAAASSPPVTQADVTELLRTAEVGPEETELIWALFHESAAEFERLHTVVGTIADEAQQELLTPGLDRDTVRDARYHIYARAVEFVRLREQITHDLFADIETALTDEHSERLERFVQRHRRRAVFERVQVYHGPLGPGAFATIEGSIVDIEPIVSELGLAEDTAELLAPVLRAYRQELHIGVTSLERALSEGMARVLTERRNRVTDSADNRPFWTSWSEASQPVTAALGDILDTQLRYESAIAETLPADRAACFRLAFNRAAFPSVYGFDPLRQEFDTALALPTLNAEQRASVGALRDRVLREADALRHDLRGMVIEQLGNNATLWVAQWLATQRTQDEETRSAYARLDQLTKNAQAQLRELLDEEQRHRAFSRQGRTLSGDNWRYRPLTRPVSDR